MRSLIKRVCKQAKRDEYMEFNEKLQELRKQKRLTQEELVKKFFTICYN